MALVALLACDRTPPTSCAPYTEDLGRFVGEAVGSRPSAGRMCGGFRHAPVTAGDEAVREENAGGTGDAALATGSDSVGSTPRAAGIPEPAFRGLARAAAEIRRAAAGGSPEQLAAAGVVSLLEGRWREAVDLLEQAADRAPAGDARYLVDLANVYLVRARAEGDPLDLLLAAETAERAAELAPELPEALFTLAAALERVGLRPEAAAVWWRFLAVESEGGWADEARQRTAHLAREPAVDVEAALLAAIDGADTGAVRRLVDRHRQRARELGERLLGEWAEAESAGDGPGAALALARAGALGRSLAGLGGDRLLADAVTAIERALASPLDRGPYRHLVTGHLAHAAGQAADAEYRPAVARDRFTEAERGLAAGGSPFAGRSKIERAAEAHRLSRWEEALTATADLTADHEVVESYPSLGARAYWLHGLAQLVAGGASAARDGYQAAIAGFERAGETGNAAYVRGLLGEERWFVGERSAAWALWLEALTRFDRLASPRNRHALTDVMADSLAELGLPRLELRLRDRLVGSEDVDGAVYRCFAHLKRSRALLRLDRRAEVQSELEIADSLLAEIADDEMRELLRVELLVNRARVARDAREADAELTEAIEFYRSRARAFPLTRLYLARARIHRGRGDREAAERDLRVAVALVEGHRGEIHHALTRGSFLASSRDVFEELISLLADRPGREEEALLAAEQGRSRTLLELALRSPRTEGGSDLETVTPQPVPPLERILEGLPFGSEALVYSVLDDRTLVWILRRSGVEMYRLHVSKAEVTLAAIELVRATASGAPAETVAKLGQRLSELIYRPVGPYLSTRGTLLVVPDGALAGVPFAALAGLEPGRLVIEDHTVVILPAAALLAGACPGPRRSIAGGTRTIVIGPPEPGPFAPVPLDGARREAERVAEVHRGAERIIGGAATEAMFLRSLGEGSLIHFAGHAVPDPRDPLRSALILSADGADGDGRLEARELLVRRFDHSPMVVLAACATHDHAGRPETGITLGTALLASGAGGVVATLWPVEDEVTEAMMVELHRDLAAGAGLAEALAGVQRRRLAEAIGKPGRGYDWSAWVALGCAGSLRQRGTESDRIVNSGGAG